MSYKCIVFPEQILPTGVLSLSLSGAELCPDIHGYSNHEFSPPHLCLMTFPLVLQDDRGGRERRRGMGWHGKAEEVLSGESALKVIYILL